MLVLSARHKAVENPFLQTLAGECRRAIYRAIAEQADHIRLARLDQREAILDEIPVPDPPAELVPRDPGARDLESAHRKRRDTGTREVYGAEQRTLLVMEASPDFGTAQVTARAVESAGMIDRVFNPIAAYHGYPWYDELDRITGISVTAAADGKRTALLDDEPNEYAGAVTRVDRITVTLHVANRCSGAKRDFALETNVSFTGNEPASHDEIGIVLMRNAWIRNRRSGRDDDARVLLDVDGRRRRELRKPEAVPRGRVRPDRHRRRPNRPPTPGRTTSRRSPRPTSHSACCPERPSPSSAAPTARQPSGSPCRRPRPRRRPETKARTGTPNPQARPQPI